ncbi:MULTISPECIES: alpha-glucosidase [unclassified Coleofasciculus]|uniref:alpha-glucosidase n=1 Tax=unclassified Coleofasciculus TaxID=2692782 RepID=UPI001880D736|nr:MULTISPECIES: alpha-glucosidase [unclassified Coleofasciculus]MBE9127128.1 alpha glucosidase [Coleofasciculus sp. LEGE 07081]MBE9149765.1 alpha glucosidase [Coleofasciculus sp. LEGE 07092]
MSAQSTLNLQSKTRSLNQKSNNWWRSAVIYQVYPRSFMDSSGDGIGDLNGILQKLDYIASLGVDAVWISPFFKSPMKDFGYDISDYCAIEPMFGTMENFKDLLKEAHDRGLKVLIDQVWNHTSDQHSWFQESRSSRDNPKADWYVWADPKDDGTPPNNWLATFGGSAWTWDAQRQQYYLHSFLIEQPDLNWYNPEVVEAILDVGRFWLDMGVDGFRLDVVNFFMYDRQLRDNPPRPKDMPRPAGAGANDPFFSNWNKYNFCQPENIEILEPIRKLMDEYPGRTTLAEISSAEDTILTSSEYVRGENRLHMAYNSALMHDSPLTCDRLREMIERVETYFQEGIICWTGGTHDFPRLKSRWRKFLIDDEFTHEAFDHMFAALLLSLRGSCCIYQGDELGLTEATIPFEKMQDPFGIKGYPDILGRDGARTPMPWQQDAHNAGFTKAVESWLPIPDEHLPHAVDQQEHEPMSLLNKYRRLMDWRKKQPALLKGNLTLVDTPEPLVGFTRKCDEQHLLCLFNLSPIAVHYNLSAYPNCVAADETDFVSRQYDHTIEIASYGVFFGTLLSESGNR